MKPAAIMLTHLTPLRIAASPLWTDGYSDIFGVLKRKHRWGGR